MNFNLKHHYFTFAIICLALSNLVLAAPALTPIYTDLNVTTPSLNANNILILIGGVYDNGEINTVANLYPGLSSSTSVQTFGTNLILIGCGPCNTNSTELANATGLFDSSIISSRNGLSTSYNGIAITNASGGSLVYIVIGNYATQAEKSAAISVRASIAKVQSPPTTTTSITTTTMATTSAPTTIATTYSTTLSTTIATTLYTTILSTTTVPQSVQTDPISAIINAILSFLRSL